MDGKSRFDLFRLNCLLSDTNTAGFRKVILSMVCDFVYENDNKWVALGECFQVIHDSIQAPLTFEVLESYIKVSGYFQMESTGSDHSIRLTESKFQDISRRIKETSVENYIHSFLVDKGLPVEKESVVIDMLYHSIYINIMYFDVKDIKTLIPQDLDKRFIKDDIVLFNNFLDWPYQGKDTAVFNLFLHAFEYALVTSGMGVGVYVQVFFRVIKFFLV
jgi:hypothetical protein